MGWPARVPELSPSIGFVFRVLNGNDELILLCFSLVSIRISTRSSLLDSSNLPFQFLFNLLPWLPLWSVSWTNRQLYPMVLCPSCHDGERR